MAWIELPGRRTQKAKHFYDDVTGKFQAVLTIHDQHYKDDADTWQDVDEAVVDDGAGFDKKCDKTRHTFRVGSGGNYRWYPRRDVLTEYVDITEIQYYTTRWRTLNLPAAVWKQQGAEWDMTDLYASITNTWRQIKSDFILKNSSAYTRLRFQVVFVGLTYNDTTGELTSTTDGLVWGYIQQPTAHDANDVDVTVTQTYASGYIEWNVVTTGATFPIYVDPTFTDGYGGDVTTAKDTSLVENDQTWNWGNSPSIAVCSPNDFRAHGLIEFDLSSIDAGVTCTSATLYLYRTLVRTVGITVNIYSIASANAAWEEGNGGLADVGEPSWNALSADGAGGITVAWAGDAGQNGGADAGCSISGTDYEASLLGTFESGTSEAVGTEYSPTLTPSRIEGWLDTPNTNYGLILRTPDDASGDAHSFGSSDHPTTGYRPKLVVEYTEEAAESASVSPSVSPSISPSVSPSASVSPSVSPSLSPSASESASISPSSSASPSAGAIIEGTVCWGHETGVIETNVRTFASNWTGTGAILNGDPDAERMELNSGEYFDSEYVNTGIRYVELLQNYYNPLGDDVTMSYKTGDTTENCDLDVWHTYVSPFISAGIVKIRMSILE